MQYAGGDSYEGDFVGGRRDGYGCYTFSSGDEYEGQWEVDKKQGQGRMQFVSGDRYDGDWYDDQVHGWGIFTWADGTSYEGYFRNGAVEGDFCPNSDRDPRTGRVKAQICDYYRGQCARCGRFDRPCPVARDLPCQLRDGKCVRCGKTEKLVGGRRGSERYAYATPGGASARDRLAQFQSERSGDRLRRQTRDRTDSVSDIPTEEPTLSSVGRPAKQPAEVPALVPPVGSALRTPGTQPSPPRPAGGAAQGHGAAAAASPPGVAALPAVGAPPQRPAHVGGAGAAAPPPATIPDPSDPAGVRAAVRARAQELLSNLKTGLGMAIADFPGQNADSTTVKVVTVKPGSPAWKAGMRRSDHLVAIAGELIRNKADFLGQVKDLAPGERLDIDVTRGGEQLQLTIIGGASLAEDDYHFLRRVVGGEVDPSEYDRVTTMQHKPGVIAW
eukprot:TRINITY_DN12678_c0_g1_i1.p1 TRINITY_DN12678_c0_g1~~TRINITY_DN12678_c0_g1_i1.p1  ORF type:complete len:443 (+),score=88.28 TRINITY_DN12678_c0_g1_i1:581-1909(+)